MKAVWITVVLVALGAAPAGAQLPTPAGPPVPGAPPAVAGPTVTPPAGDPRVFSLTGAVLVDGAYTDNFFRASTHPEAEYRETLTPSVDMHLRPAQGEARMVYTPTVVHSSLSNDELKLFHLLDADGGLRLGDRLTLRATEHFIRHDEPILTDPSGLSQGRSFLTRNVVAGGLTYEQDRWTLTPRYSLTFNETEVDETTSAPSSTTSPTSGVTERTLLQTLGLDGGRAISDRTNLGATYEFTRADFKVAENFVSHFGLVSISREIRSLLTAKADVSLVDRQFADDTVSNIYRGGVEARWTPLESYTLLARVGYVRATFPQTSDEGVEYAVTSTYSRSRFDVTVVSSRLLQDTSGESVNAGFIKATIYGADIRYQPAELLVLTLSARYRENVFTESSGASSTTTVVTAGGQERRDRLTTVGLAATYAFTRRVSLIAGYDYTRDDSNVAGISYSTNRVHFSVRMAFE